MAPSALLFALLTLFGEQRQERWPDGKLRAEYEVELDGGVEVKSGKYRAWHADGTLASEGHFAGGERTGKWRFYHPGGELLAEGSDARGKRKGPWRAFHPDGARASEGAYAEDERTGAWSFWLRGGERDAAESGSYAFEESVDAQSGQRVRGARLDGRWHGAWSVRRANGTPLLDRWEAALRAAVLDSQEVAGEQRGSWAPIGAWGSITGRTGTTALMLPSLAAPRRFALPAPEDEEKRKGG
jgi:hypothetical protein